MTDQLELHRMAYRAVAEALPGSVHISHTETRDDDWETPEVSMPEPTVKPLDGCKTCGDPVHVAGLTVKCRDWHEVCQCGARYDQPKSAGCRRRKHPKEEK